MKIDKIKQAIKINAKLVELGIDINSKDWESFNFKLDEWGNLIIKSGKLDHKPFVSCKNENKNCTLETLDKVIKELSVPLENSDQLNKILSKLELTFENVKEFANDNGFELKEYKGFYKLYPLNSKFGTAKYIGFNTLQEVINYLSELK